MGSVTLQNATAIIEAALEQGSALKAKPLSVAVLDQGGHLIAFQRQDGSSLMRPQIAMAKAGGALALGMPSRKIADMAAERPSFIASLGAIWPQGIVPAAGGVIIADTSGAIVGAVGISGDTPDNDEACVLAGIAATELQAQD